MVGFGLNEKKLDVIFAVVFSIVVFALFFSLVGSNGLVLGNDPAVHLETAKYYLSTKHLPSSDILWLPPLYQLVLATFLTFTGATSVSQQLVVMKLTTATIDWLLVFSVYLLATKLFNKRTGVLAASVILLFFPLYEINSWGGYTSILSLVFMTMLFAYLSQPAKNIGNTLAVLIFSFSVVLSHQLATFVLAFILPPFIVVVLLKSKGNYPKALIGAIIGGVVAFGIYYLGPLLPYLGDLVDIVFFQLKTMSYQIPSVSYSAFIMYFGFTIFLGFGGLAISFFELKKRKLLSIFLLLSLAFLVPFVFSQSYLLGLYLPYQWFVYYLLPVLAVLTGLGLKFALDVSYASYKNNRSGLREIALKIVSIVIVAILIVVVSLQFQTLNGKLAEATTFYSSSDMSAYQAGTWLREHNTEGVNVTVSQKPGHWFWVYSGLSVITETDPIVEWNAKAETVLDLSYELSHPLTMVRVYEAKTGISDENYVSTNMVWKRITFSPLDNAYVTYRDVNETLHIVTLASLNRTISMDLANSPKKININYASQDFGLEENILMENDTYPVTVVWRLTATNGDLTYASLYLSEFFDQRYTFNQAYIPGILNWQNPLENPSKQSAGQWALSSFYSDNLTSNSFIGVYDEKNQAAFALKFTELPLTGNVGALANGNIDAVRWQYDFYRINANYTISVSYQTLAFSMTSETDLKSPQEMSSLFGLKTSEPFAVVDRNFASVIRDNYIVYLVYDVNRLDKKILSSGWVEQVFANDKYVILRIKADHPYTYISERLS